jgi:hypothetical protein
MDAQEILSKLLENGWTRRQIAGAMFVSYETVQKWATGQKNIPTYQFEHLKRLPESPPPDAPKASMRRQNPARRSP